MKKLRIITDFNPINPREWDNVGTMAYKHSHYELGEKKIENPIEWLERMLGLVHRGIQNKNRFKELEDKFFKEYIALPLYLYDHSGITIRTYPFSCPWDSMKVGYIYIAKSIARSEFGWKQITQLREMEALNYLNNEVKVFDQYLTGDVYGFVIEEDGEIVDSCYGFYGTEWDKNGLIEQIPEELHSQLEGIEIEHEYV